MSLRFDAIRALTALGAFVLLLIGCDDPPAELAVDDLPRDREVKTEVARNELIRLQPNSVPRPADASPNRGDEITVSRLDLTFPSKPTPVDQEAANLNIRSAAWESEALSESTGRQLKQLALPLELSALENVVAPEFECGLLRPAELVRVVQRSGITVFEGRIEGKSAPDVQSARVFRGTQIFRGAGGLIEALRDSRRGFDSTGMVTRFKSVGINVSGDGDSSFSTEALLETSGPALPSGNLTQVNARWTCTWRKKANDVAGDPLLLRIRLDSYEEAVLVPNQGRSPKLFVDATASAMRSVPFFREQQLRGIEFWCKRVTRLGDMALTGHHGLAVGDVNGDGLEDVYVCDGGSLPNRLYIQNVDGSVRDASAQSGVDWLEDSRSALLIDLDNDGDQDLVVATIAIIVFAENDGSGKFSLRGGHRGAPYPYSLSAADYDGDGDLDIYACVYAGGDDSGRDGNSGARGFELRSPVPYSDANNGGRNILLANYGSFRFADVTNEVGLNLNNTRWSFAAAWEDYDRDGDPDLYVANDFGRNNLYQNRVTPDGKRKFVDVAAETGTEDTAAGMSVAWGDYNRDGRMDIYVGNMYSSAGNRIAYQRSFTRSKEASTVRDLQRMARGSSLFAAGPPGTTNAADTVNAADAASVGGIGSMSFTDHSAAVGVAMGRWAWSSGFVDINNDGWEDIVIANGYLTNRREVDL